MARTGTKRTAPAPQSDDEESGNARRREMKRVKIEKHAERRAEDEEEEEGEEEGESSDSTISEPDIEEEQDLSDEDSLMSDYEDPSWKDDVLVQAYQRSKQKAKGYVGATSEAGVLKSMTLVDFMCHRHLTIEFCSKMNFLVGHNGSGKSAVLTAIAVVLGGKAVSTGRGQGLKDLIRKTADKATISVTITNSGPEAFRPEVYDPYIVIERTISLNGSSSYKFKASKDGRTVANKRSELTAICENFNITIDSPLTILTQDQARSFLQNADPGKMYKFFLNGTQLSSLLETYESSVQNIKQIQTHVNRQIDALPALREKKQNLARKMLANEAVYKQKDKYKKILNELAWAYVTDRETERDRYQGVVDENEEKSEQAQTELHKLEKKIIQLADEIRQTEKDIANYEEGRKPLQKAVQDARDKLKNEKRELNSLSVDINTIQEDIDAEKGGLQILQSKIDAKLRVNVDAQRSEHAKLMEDRRKFEELATKLRKEKPKKHQQVIDKTSEIKIARRDVQDIQYQIEQQQQNAGAIQNQINNLEGQSVNRLSAFGQGLDAVMREIKQTRWRHSPPLGPLGMFVKLDDMFYRDIIQTILGQTLCGFAVRDPQDRTTLMKLLEKHMRSGYRPGTGAPQIPPVLLHHGDVFDFSRGDLSHIGPTILSKLTLENDHVLRLLVTLHRVERTFLARTVQQANQEMKRLHHDRTLDHVSFYSADFQQISGTSSSKQSGPTGRWRGNMLFTRDLKDEIQQARANLQECHAQIQRTQGQRQEAQGKVQQMDSELRDLSNQLEKVTKSIPPAEQRLDDIRRKLAEMSSTEMDNWEADRADRMQKIQDKETQLQSFYDDQKKIEENIERFKGDIDDRQKDLDEHAPQMQRQAQIMTKLVQQRADTTNKKAHYEKSLLMYQQKRDTAAAQAEDYVGQVEEWAIKAQAFCPERVATTRPTAEIAAQRRTLETTIKEAEKQLGVNSSHLSSEHRKAKHLLKDVLENIVQMRRLVKVFERAMVNRKLWWNETRSHTAIRAKTAFVVFESYREMEGRLEFDHLGETLRLIVHSTTRTENKDGELTSRSHYKTAKNLSGGERSFSTVSLLLALWSTVPCPIRALDEWDVFLDAANRKVAAKSLMDGARESDGKQFILITPQDMSGIEISGPDKKVIRMADPNRNQGTLPFQ